MKKIQIKVSQDHNENVMKCDDEILKAVYFQFNVVLAIKATPRS